MLLVVGLNKQWVLCDTEWEMMVSEVFQAVEKVGGCVISFLWLWLLIVNIGGLTFSEPRTPFCGCGHSQVGKFHKISV